jgi:hypothetical protein
MSKLENSWTLIKASATVLNKNKKLIILPAVSGLLVILLSVVFFIPSLLRGEIKEPGHLFSSIYSVLYFMAYYFCSYSIVIFFNSVLITAALSHLKGEEISLGECFSSSLGKLGIILGYALIATTVGLILQWISDKAGLLGKIFTFLASMAWNIITFLVVPVLVAENIGPIDAIKRSAALLKETWGENIIGNMGLSFLFGVIVIVLALVVSPLAIFFAASHMFSVTILIGIAFGLMAIIIGLISSTLSAIYTASLYLFASKGEAGNVFPKELMQEAFKTK